MNPLNTCFAVIGDYGDGTDTEEGDVANLVKSWNPEFIATTGDNNYPDGEAATIDANIGQYYQKFIFPYVGTYGPGATVNSFFPAMGNHDWNDLVGAQPYLDYFTLPRNERYYNFTWGPVEFFMLDSDRDEPDGRSSTSIQANWLQSQLAASTATWKVVMSHHAPYNSKKSNTVMQWPYEAWGADIVLAGHVHNYERLIVDGFPYITNGSGGAGISSLVPTLLPESQVAYDGDYGAQLVEASSTHLTFQFINRDSELIDIYTLASGTPHPDLSITATDDTASESGSDQGTFTISRTGSTSAPLTVNYTAGGTATNGSDYNLLSGSVTISIGASSAPVDVIPIDDSIPEWIETVEITLDMSTDYNLGATRTASVTINDDEITQPPLIVESRVIASTDDAEEDADGDVDLDSSDLELVFDGSNQAVGMRFNQMTIPQGATIISANIQFEADEVNSGPIALIIEGEDADNSTTFLDVDFDISSRPRTAASVP